MFEFKNKRGNSIVFLTAGVKGRIVDTQLSLLWGKDNLLFGELFFLIGTTFVFGSVYHAGILFLNGAGFWGSVTPCCMGIFLVLCTLVFLFYSLLHWLDPVVKILYRSLNRSREIPAVFQPYCHKG